MDARDRDHHVGLAQYRRAFVVVSARGLVETMMHQCVGLELNLLAAVAAESSPPML